MASLSPEPAVPAEKSLKPTEATEMTEATEKDARNGSEEMNGHALPSDAKTDAQSPPKSPVASNGDASGDVNGDANGVEEEEKPDAPATESIPQSDAPEVESSETKAVESTEKEVEPEQASADDAEMADAPAQESVEAERTESAPPLVAESKDASPAPDVADKPSAEEAKADDVEMSGVSPTAAAPSSAEPAASTQDTAVSDPPAATPAEDLNLHPASMSSLAIDATPASPAPATTADTSMSDPPPTGRKVAREREEDDEDDQPQPKRVKTNSPRDSQRGSAEAKTPSADAMAVDKAGAKATSLYDEDGKPKHLADPSLDNNEISKYQSNKIRGILAGIKKTKAGNNFKASVAQLWPLLWEDYRQKVSEPTDITTMEKRLKGTGDPEFPPYPNLGAFKKDLQLIYQNSLTFNGAMHTVTAAAKQVWEQVLERMSSIPAVETSVEEKKAPKQHPTRHTEPRAAAHPSSAQPPRRPASKPPVASPADKAAPSPAYAIPPNNHGVPLIRRDSTKNVDDRPKRPVHPPKSKDLGYDVKKKNKMPLELRFCKEVLDELTKNRHFDVNQFFIQPVDPVALQIPNYHKMVKKPMDLQTMGERLDTGQYNNAREFERDFHLIVRNAVLFNGEEHIVTQCAHRLEDLFKEEWAKKDAWLAKRAPPPSAPQPSSASRLKHEEDSDEEDAESEEEEEQKPAAPSTAHLDALMSRLKEEQDKLNELMTAKLPDLSMVEVSQSLVAMFQKQIIQERQKMAEVPAPKNKKAKQTATKAKKPSASGRKASAQTAASSGGGAGGRKAGGGPKKAKRFMGVIEKDVIGTAISALPQGEPSFDRAIDIIKKDTNQSENDSGELELDLDALSQDALAKLYDIAVKEYPDLRAQKEAEHEAAAAPPREPTPPPRPKPSSKPKKNKPMGKTEQEAMLRHLSELKAKVKAGLSTSQEPMESIEGNGNGGSAADPQPMQVYPSEDEESSEEE